MEVGRPGYSGLAYGSETAASDNAMTGAPSSIAHRPLRVDDLVEQPAEVLQPSELLGSDWHDALHEADWDNGFSFRHWMSATENDEDWQ